MSPKDFQLTDMAIWTFPLLSLAPRTSILSPYEDCLQDFTRKRSYSVLLVNLKYKQICSITKKQRRLGLSKKRKSEGVRKDRTMEKGRELPIFSFSSEVCNSIISENLLKGDVQERKRLKLNW